MKLYEIDAAIAGLVDENGEILDFEAFEHMGCDYGQDDSACRRGLE